MEEVSNKDGRTILFVSHDLSAVSSLTQKSILLKNGIFVRKDDTRKVINEYSSFLKTEFYFQTEAVKDTPTVTSVKLQTSEEGNLQSHGKPLSIEFEISMPQENSPNMALSFQVFNTFNQPVLFNWIFDIENQICRLKGKNYLKFTYENLRLYKGDYYLKVHLAETKGKNKFQEFECCNFSVEMIDSKMPEWGWQNNVALFLDEGVWIK